MFKEKLASLPEKPGCYLMKDVNGRVIYVGKAKVLKNRVKSYFTGSHNQKTEHLIAEVADFEIMVTHSETESLILENDLIKKYKPKYNILLKDDKYYPYIKITNEPHPRLLIVRQYKKDGSHYFGPYPHGAAAQEVKDFLDRLFPLRKCEILPKKVCLYYHLGQCLAPCEYEVTASQNQQMVKQIKRLLDGNTKQITTLLTTKMEEASSQLQFEQAGEYRDLLQKIQTIAADQSHILLHDDTPYDVFGFASQEGKGCMQTFFIRNGKMLERKGVLYDQPEETESLETFIMQFYDRHPKPKEIWVPRGLNTETLSAALHVPVKSPLRGTKHHLLKLAETNAQTSLEEMLQAQTKKGTRNQKGLTDLVSLLDIERPQRIEMVDISHTQGVHGVGATVCMEEDQFQKSEYRKYKIKTVTGSDDYASLREVLSRRLHKQPLPELLLIDGGAGQVHAAEQVLHEFGMTFPVCGVVKDDHHRTDHLLFREKEFTISKTSELFYFLTRFQDEVHRFVLTFHRQQQTKAMTHSVLDDIPGVGPASKRKLLSHFHVIEAIKQATVDNLLQSGISPSVAQKLFTYFHPS